MPLVDPADFIHLDENAIEISIDDKPVIAVFSQESVLGDEITRMTRSSILFEKTELANYHRLASIFEQGDLDALEGIRVKNGLQNYEILSAKSVGQHQFWRLRLKRAK